MAFSLDQFYRINRRALTWILLLLVIWLMRDFFGVIFMTFVLSFIAGPLARFLRERLHFPRRLSILSIYLLLLLAVISFVKFVTPQVLREAGTLVENLDDVQERLIEVKDSLVGRNPSINTLVMGYIRSHFDEEEKAAVYTAQKVAYTEGIGTDVGLDEALTAEQRRELDNAFVRHLTGKLLDEVRTKAPEYAALMFNATATLLLAMLFSFLITLDISRLREEVKNLRLSRLHDIYDQTAGPVVRFAYVVGRAIQAQAMIACCNTILTVIGLAAMGVPSIAVLALIVFVCSFIPVLGVFISTTPVVLVALNSGGVWLALGMIGFVCVIHAIEAYLLNPLIYGKHLKLNPVIVLIILFVAYHGFGLWGMLLGVPVTHYFLHDVFGVPIWTEKRLAPRTATPQNEGKPGASLASLPRQELNEADLHHPNDAGARIDPEESVQRLKDM